jgi:hypothetical protein
MDRKKLKTSILKQRPCLRYIPEWSPPFQIWSRRWVDRNFWRVAEKVGTKEDAMQECALIFSRCAMKYRDTIDNPAWFMGIYKVSVINEWNRYSLKARIYRDHEFCMTARESELLDQPSDDNAGPLLIEFAECRREIANALDLISELPSETLSIFLARDERTSTRPRMLDSENDLVRRISTSFARERLMASASAHLIIEQFAALLAV